jgi:hypothetical protein
VISKQSNGPKWLWSPNNINQSVIGIKMSQPIANGWSFSASALLKTHRVERRESLLRRGGRFGKFNNALA